MPKSWPWVQSNAVYEDQYLLGTSLARISFFFIAFDVLQSDWFILRDW